MARPLRNRALEDLHSLGIHQHAAHPLRGVEMDVGLVGERIAQAANADTIKNPVDVYKRQSPCFSKYQDLDG